MIALAPLERSRRNAASFASSVRLLMIVAAFGAAVQPIRLFGIYNTAPLVLIASYLAESLLVYNTWFRIRLTRLEWFCITTVWGSGVWGLVLGNQPAVVLTDVIEPTLFVLVVGVVRSYGASAREPIRLKREVSWVLAGSIISVAAVLAAGSLGFSAKLSATSMNLAFAGFWLYVFGGRLRFIAAASLFALGGKVGALLAILTPLVILNLTSLRRISRIFLPLTFVLLALWVWGPTSDSLERVPVLDKVISPALLEGSPTLEELDREILGERIAEAKSAWNGLEIAVNQTSSRLVLGGGAGYSYELKNFDQTTVQGQSHGVHFSPLSLVVIYGLAGALPWILFLGCAGNAALRLMIKGSGMSVVWSAYVVGVLVASMTAFSLFANPLFAVAVGVVLSHDRAGASR